MTAQASPSKEIKISDLMKQNNYNAVWDPEGPALFSQAASSFIYKLMVIGKKPPPRTLHKSFYYNN
jgi:hypothetical protein